MRSPSSLCVLAATALSSRLANAAFFGELSVYAILLMLVTIRCHLAYRGSLAACPVPCEATLLPRDMESFEDCVCRGNMRPGGAFRCPAGSAARMLHPVSFGDCSCLPGYSRDETRATCTPDTFRCLGRYTEKAGVEEPESIADCDCLHPYTKDDATGQCALRECPRAGNYVEKSRRRPVASLADCACLSPFVKNDQTGECVASEKDFQCPPHSQAPNNVSPRSFADCYCEWGYIKSASKGECVRESASYVCPRDSTKRADLPVSSNARGFFDCECIQQGTMYTRNEFMQSCDKIRQPGDDRAGGGGGAIATLTEPFACPPFSKPLTAMPYSVEQCECLPGYGWKTPDMVCVRMSAYQCPLHSYKLSVEKHVEEAFDDCECASGYYRDDTLQRCIEWFLANDNGCPTFAYLKHWPLQSKANCECIYGLQTQDQVDGNDRDAAADATTKPPKQKKTALKCNESPPMMPNGAFTFSECPANSFANDWPVASIFECSCLYGYEVAPASEQDLSHGDGELFQCGPSQDVDFEEQALTCRPPMAMSALTGLCRLPLEEVQPRAAGDTQLPSEGTVLFRGIEYDYVLTDDNVMVTQGDIAIGELLAWNESAAATNEVAQLLPSTSHVLHGYYNSERDHRWKDGEMCFQVDLSARRFSAMVRDAMAHITAVTGFTFKECIGGSCRDDPQCSHDFVNVRATSSSCYSYIGRIGGQQPLGVSAQCGLGNVIHVLLHAVGLHHTIDRADRDDHVRIAWECVPEAKRTHFIIEQDAVGGASAEVPYDFFSIMHHPSDAFVHSASTLLTNKSAKDSPAWCQSVFPVISDMDERLAVLASMGQRELLAVTDIHAVWRLYPALQVNDKPATYASNGTDSSKPTVFASRLHSHEDTKEVAERSSRASRRKSRFSQRAASFFGAIAMLGGFGAFLAFAVAEIRKRALQGADAFYSESLLTDKAQYD